MRSSLLALMFLGLLGLACSSHPPKVRPSDAMATSDAKLLRKAMRHLDAVAAHLDEFGTISASSPVLLGDPAQLFAFDLELSAEEIFQYHRVEGASSLLDLRATSARGAARLRAPTGDGVAPVESPETPDPASAAALPDPKFSAGQEIRDPGTLGLNLRDLIRLTADDHTTLKILEWLSSPALDAENKVLMAGILSVSIRPGWRTYEGYVGEIDVRPRYVVGGTVVEDPLPVAFAVFPGVEAQVTDDRSSLRRQLALAMALEAQGPQAGGSLDADTVRRIEQDVATVTATNTVVGYNAAGFHFGWRFSPRLQARGDASDPRSGPGRFLQPQSFPALFFVFADKTDVPASVGGSCEAAPPKSGCPTEINFDFTYRWARAPAPGPDDSWVPFSGSWHRASHPRPKEGWLAELALAIAEAEAIQGQLAEPESVGAQLLEKRIESLYSAIYHEDAIQLLPD